MEQMRDLVDKLNYLTQKYDEGHPEVSDKEWDDLYFQLFAIEQATGEYYPDSPTRRVNYQFLTELIKVTHNHKMLSLDKTKNLEDVRKFTDKHEMVAMTKVDGLTCSLRYINGKLVSAETRGDGVIGEDVLHNALTIPTIPHKINYKDELIVDGEIVCLRTDFEDFQETYKNPRNFASGSIRLLDSSECAKRKLTFIAWDMIKGFDDLKFFSEKLIALKSLGFFVVPFIKTSIIDEEVINVIGGLSYKMAIPLDGVVFKFEDIAYGKAQGETTHHFKNAIAFKFYDESYETNLKDILWTMGRTGVLTPIAVFDSVDMDGSVVSRASLHNINTMKEVLGETPYMDQKVWIYKANMIIPQIEKAEKRTSKDDKHFSIPEVCPFCGKPVEIIKADSGTIELYCINSGCEGKLINRLDHFCGKKGLDIKGLSIATLEKLITWGWVNNIVDIFSLKEHRAEWVKQSGFGPKSVDNILQAIENSKNCSFEAFISSLSIPLIGKAVATELVKHFESYEVFSKAIKENFDFSQFEGFAESKTKALLDFDYSEADQLYGILNVGLGKIAIPVENQPLAGKKFVITGSVESFKNRAELQAFIEKLGGKVVSTISKNVDYLINNDIESTSAKNMAAKKIGIPILSEAELLRSLD